MSTLVNVVVSCTNRKKLAVPNGLRLRDFPAGSIEDLSVKWRNALKRKDNTQVCSARHLYSGDHWFVVQSLAECAASKGLEVCVWICSAGYGLIPLEANIKPYSATFSTNNTDSIHRFSRGASTVDLNQRWWSLLQGGKKSVQGKPRSITNLARQYPDAPILVAASPRYLTAIAKDLRQARNELSFEDQLSIFSAGTTSLSELKSSLIPCDARLQNAFGGPRFSLNVRAVREALSSSARTGLQASKLRTKFKALMKRQPEIPRYNRAPMKDPEVEKFILAALRNKNPPSQTALLRVLRDSNRACEQKRFADLYKRVSRGMNSA